ncbi:hypothetical protein EIB18_19435 [Caulobacter vibrioides]|uniref:hypothetical protein n=1 Tax=Caulobacter vibrioides TaxID=155892 RepID=UPI000BB4A80A|nr:hypothetical protein [Caulobacter vibrioides]ATC26567.1 hypothetical protein CA608_19550 [Caulobacter vibrioides]AZH14654.1 hypothetical protein EIB18_19435 [Caulobacter vibrioides]PLR12392.1 hypothetical protein CVUC_09180 [Caulobacter vibrioides]
MNRQKIIFLVVLGAVAVFIAAMVRSMLPTHQVLANGYQVSVGGKGETWVRTPDRKALITEVTSVWASRDRMLIERHPTDDKPPFKLLDCDYQLGVGREALRLIPAAEARAMMPGLRREAASPKTCVK